MPRSHGLVDELSERVGTRVNVGIGLGRLDSWWKPVLQVFDDSGLPVAFAKVGWTPMTRLLVDNEAHMLSEIEDRVVGLVVPKLIDHFTFGPVSVTVTAPLHEDCVLMDQARMVDPPKGMVDALGGTAVELHSADWWLRCQRILGDAHTLGSGLDDEWARGLVDGVENRFGSDVIDVGVQHGDWVPWNIATNASGSVTAWDWEYGVVDGPAGLDVVHGKYQGLRLLSGLSDADALSAVHANTSDLLVVLHLVMLITRRIQASKLGAVDEHGDREVRAVLNALSRSLREAS